MRAVRSLATAYARELDAQLGTLALFTKHGPENGRVHEHYLRSVLRRFLPGHLHVGSGFVALPNWTSAQLDIVVHDPAVAPLFTAGDLIVANGVGGPVAAVEVKTTLDGRELLSGLNSCLDLKSRYVAMGDPNRHPFFGIYAGQGIALDTLTDHFHEWAQKSLPNFRPDSRPPETRQLIPDAIVVRGRYACLRNSWMSDPYVAVDLTLPQDAPLGDGVGLLGLVATLYEVTRLPPYQGPWWLQCSSAASLLNGIEKGEVNGQIMTWGSGSSG